MESRRTSVIERTIGDEGGSEPRRRRRRLLDLLDPSGAGCVAVVVAGVGCGKTQLLAEWYDDAPTLRRVLSVDVAEAPDAFLRHLGDELAVLAQQGPARPPSRRPLRPSSAESFSELPIPTGVGLAIDGLDRVMCPSVEAALRRLVNAWPVGSTLILSSRTPPDLPYFRGDPSAPFRRLGESHLEFDDRDLMDTFDRDEDRVAEVLALTGRWPAGVSALASAGAVDGAALLRRLVRRTVLPLFDDAELDFLGEVAITAPMELSLMNEAFGRDDVGAALHSLRERGLPLVRVPARSDGVVAVESVLADVVVERLLERAPEAAEAALAAAIGAASAVDAAEHVLALSERVADPELHRNVCYRQALHLCVSGRESMLRVWIDRVGGEVGGGDRIEGDPRIAIPTAMSLEPPRSEEIRAMLAPYLDDAPGDRWPPLPDGRDVAATARQACVLLGLEPCRPSDIGFSDDLWSGLLAHWYSWQLHAAGDASEADRMLRSDPAIQPTYPFVEAKRLSRLALLAFDRGDDAVGADLVRSACAVRERGGFDDADQGLIVDVARMRRDRSARHLDDARAAAVRLERHVALVGEGRVLECLYALLSVADVLLDAGHDADVIDDVVVRAHGLAASWPEPAFVGWLERVDHRLAVARPRAGRVRGELELTAAELRVLGHLASHLPLPEVAELLFVSTNTVRSHRSAIFRKLGVSSRTDAVAVARRHGLLSGSTGDAP